MFERLISVSKNYFNLSKYFCALVELPCCFPKLCQKGKQCKLVIKIILNISPQNVNKTYECRENIKQLEAKKV